jgi:ABC-type nickel/cobalt efflux system permease component RcnA
VNQISENSSVRLGLGLLILGGAWMIWEKMDAIQKTSNEKVDAVAKSQSEELKAMAKIQAENMDQNYVRKDLFLSEMSSLKREMELQFAPIRQRLTEVGTSLDAAQKAASDK